MRVLKHTTLYILFFLYIVYNTDNSFVPVRVQELNLNSFIFIIPILLFYDNFIKKLIEEEYSKE
jgi:hypothetical protein